MRFYDGNKVIATVQVSSVGTAATILSASSLPNGKHTFTASYSGGANYAAGTGAPTVTVAH